ncbi:hypothetical protein L6Q96_01865 [Candidatus Binatia bacterium]|nr:hypothetical protein [Candidatus Binatia bacterium]
MNTSAKGRRLEGRSKAVLEAAGYTVIRAAASKGPFDLVGWSATDVVPVQCKANRPPGPGEREALRLVPVPPNGRRLIHVWMDRQRWPRVVEV